jgi:hypothetical protein
MHKTLYAILLMVAAVGTSDAQTPMAPCANCGWQDHESSVTGALTAPSINSVLNAASFSGSDIGAKINEAIAALPNRCGEVIVPSGTYRQTTTIIKPRCIKLHGQGTFGTTLNWRPKDGTALVSEDSTGVNDYPEGEVADITLSGPGSSTGTIGTYIGGDPTGSTISVYFNNALCTATNMPAGCPKLPIPSTAYDDHQNFNRVRILNFGTGVQWGNNAWSTTMSQSLISNNGVGLYFPSGLTDSGESITVSNTRIQNNATGLSLVGFSDFYFYGSSCDYNTITCGNVNAAHFYGEHFEQSSGIILTITGSSQPHVEIFGGAADLTAATGTDPEMFYVSSTLNPTFKMDGTAIIASHPVTNIVNWNGSGGSASLILEDLPYYVNIAAPTNAACNFWGCHIQDGQGNLAFSGKHAQVLMNGAALFLTVTTGTGSSPGASIGNVSGFAEVRGNSTGLRLDPTDGRSTTPIYFTNGTLNATGVSVVGSSYAPAPSTLAPTGSCTVAGTLQITADGHATYCKAGTLIWTTLY